MSTIHFGALVQPAILEFIALLLVVPTVGRAQGEPVFLDDFESGGVCWWSSAVGAEPPCSECFGQPDNTPCGETIYSNCGSCSYSSQCDETGTQPCDCTFFACNGGTCQATVSGCTRECIRNTDGQICGTQVCGPGPAFEDLCCLDGSCVQVCSACLP